MCVDAELHAFIRKNVKNDSYLVYAYFEEKHLKMEKLQKLANENPKRDFLKVLSELVPNVNSNTAESIYEPLKNYNPKDFLMQKYLDSLMTEP